MARSAVLILFALAVVAGCHKVQCPKGQESREERLSPAEITARGCVGKDASGNYRFQGKWQFLHKNGQKVAEGTYIDGLPDSGKDEAGIPMGGRQGPWSFWYENGNKKGEAVYRDGKVDGVRTEWHKNGKKKLESTYKAGKLDGAATTWHENGQKQMELRHVDGNIDGIVTTWYESGNKHADVPYKNGKREGVTTFWYENGKKKSESTFRNGDEVVSSRVFWDDDGDRIAAKQDVAACCRCLVSTVAAKHENVPDEYCLEGASRLEAASQCEKALENGAPISVSAECSGQLCAEDCWVLQDAQKN